ncbi:MAG: hypothetical protein QG639_1094, partial [Patescibacteria group bacterium]|nr:hypothetical protein [Patescibacteria group bacterium]
FSSHPTKEKIILNVGRFYKQLHAKRQDILIEAFKELTLRHTDLMKGWKLILVGTIEDTEYVQSLQTQIGSAPIQLMNDVSRSELIDLYQKSSVYWHATGYDVDEESLPEKVEHFGISTVEAMAAGAVPIVHYKGGQKEILGEDLKQLGWISIEECIENTASVIKDKQQLARFQTLARNRSEFYSKDIFDRKVEKLFSV